MAADDRAPYDAAAETYLASKLWPIPVRGKFPPVKFATGYDGTVTFERINAWLHTDSLVRARAGRGSRMDNVAIRHQLTLAIDVDAGYGDKDGVTQLAAFAEEHGLPPLEATWSSTARGDDSPSRQYFYRIPADIRFKTKPCKAVELCGWHHRYSVVAPSIHPGTGTPYGWYLPGQPGVPPTWGERTTRIPRADMFPVLHEAWFEVFRGTAANADRTGEVVAAGDLIAGFPPGDPDALIRSLIARWSDPAQHVGHDEAKDAFIHALMLGREGHPGVRELLLVLWNRLLGYLQQDRPRVAEREARSLLSACADIAQQKPIAVLPRLTPTTAAPVDDDTWAAFLNTFVEGADHRAATRRAGWLTEDLRRHGPRAMHHHAVKAFNDVLAGRYPAARAVELLSAAAPHDDVSDTLRAALGAALANMEGATQ